MNLAQVHITLAPVVIQIHLLVISQVPKHIIKIHISLVNIILSILVATVCNNYPKVQWLKINILFFSCFMGQEFWKNVIGFRTSHAGAVKCWLKLQSSEYLVELDSYPRWLTLWIAADAGSWLRAWLRLPSTAVHADSQTWYSQGIQIRTWQLLFSQQVFVIKNQAHGSSFSYHGFLAIITKSINFAASSSVPKSLCIL